MDVIQKLSLAGIIPVIKVEDAADAVPLCKALSDGGLPVAEITFRSDAAEEAIRLVRNALPEVILGAGTVLTTEQVDRAVAAGATYIVSPGLNPTVVSYCVENSIPVVPGCANPSDIELALSLGVQTVKLFPAEALGGLSLIKAMSAPYGNVTFIPTGGINEKNLNDYLGFPKILACGGSWMVPVDAIANKDWERVRALTKTAVDRMLGLELTHVAFNTDSPEAATQEAEKLASLLGWPVKEGTSSIMVGAGFELTKRKFPGTNGHIAVGCNNILRAKWHLEQRGFKFNEESAVVRDGKLKSIYLCSEIMGFAFHLLQR